MSAPTILLTGKNGQVGFELQRALAPMGVVMAVDQGDCDLADEAAVRAMVQRVQPAVIVNPAAYTAVDKAELDVETTAAINATAPLVLGEEAAKLGALVVHYSTDYVFDGKKTAAYTEADAPNPQSIYGSTKLQGERAIAGSGTPYMILRTSWVVGAHGCNFAKTMLRLAAERDSLNVVADQWGAPTSAGLLADVTAHVVHRFLQDGAAAFPSGLYHVVAGGETNWCDYARFVVQEAVAAGHPIKATPDRIHAITTADYPTPAKRPANSRLDTTLFQKTFGLRLPPWQDGVRHILQQIL